VRRGANRYFVQQKLTPSNMKRVLIISGIVVVLLAGLFFYLRMRTKSFSPETTVQLEHNGATVSVFYNRPLKKGREIFGSLVPYDQVWRTGANEATVFSTTKALTIGDKTLPGGKYSIWTIPQADKWTIIFNSEYGQWGVNFNGEVNRKSEKDVLSAEAPAVTSPTETEQFTISLEKMDNELELVFMWDKTLVALPFSVNQ
jgi:hypothetical protein